MADIDVSVIVPTYCEAENLPTLVPRVAAALGASRSWEMIVVDDDSGDGMDLVCAELAGRFPLRLIIRRGQRGLATAVVRGLREARGAVLVVLDADLSHPPEAIGAMLARINHGADFVVGSRYCPGGDIEEGWGLCRRWNSRVATWLASSLVGIADPMSGFFALRRRLFEGAPDLDPTGYKIGLELMVKLAPDRVEEVPITFARRRNGRSKLNLRQRMMYLLHLRRLRSFRRKSAKSAGIADDAYARATESDGPLTKGTACTSSGPPSRRRS